MFKHDKVTVKEPRGKMKMNYATEKFCYQPLTRCRWPNAGRLCVWRKGKKMGARNFFEGKVWSYKK